MTDMWDEWAVADTVDAELINPGEVIRFTDDGQNVAGEVVSVDEQDDGTWLIIVDGDLDMERVELVFQWDDQVDVLYRNYAGVEV